MFFRKKLTRSIQKKQFGRTKKALKWLVLETSGLSDTKRFVSVFHPAKASAKGAPKSAAPHIRHIRPVLCTVTTVSRQAPQDAHADVRGAGGHRRTGRRGGIFAAQCGGPCPGCGGRKTGACGRGATRDAHAHARRDAHAYAGGSARGPRAPARRAAARGLHVPPQACDHSRVQEVPPSKPTPAPFASPFAPAPDPHSF